MINATIFKSAFVSLVLISFAMARPADSESKPEEPHPDILDLQSSKPSTTTTLRPTVPGDHYDQRQNGTKNFRIHVDGVVFLVAPAEALLLAGELDPSLLGIGQGGSSSKPEAEDNDNSGSLSLLADDSKKLAVVKRKSAHGFVKFSFFPIF